MKAASRLWNRHSTVDHPRKPSFSGFRRKVDRGGARFVNLARSLRMLALLLSGLSAVPLKGVSDYEG